MAEKQSRLSTAVVLLRMYHIINQHGLIVANQRQCVNDHRSIRMDSRCPMVHSVIYPELLHARKLLQIPTATFEWAMI